MKKTNITVTNLKDIHVSEISIPCYRCGIPEAAEIENTLKEAKANKDKATIYADPEALAEAINEFYWSFVSVIEENDESMTDEMEDLHQRLIKILDSCTYEKEGKIMSLSYLLAYKEFGWDDAA